MFPPHTVIATLSGPGGSTLRTFNVLTGHLLLEKRLHAPNTGSLFEPGDLGLGIAFVPGSTPNESELLVLTNGHTLRRVDAKTGEVVWSWTSEDQRYVYSFIYSLFVIYYTHHQLFCYFVVVVIND
jgi:ER membrane protein complex subunit 1